jgi:hypothetical protein
MTIPNLISFATYNIWFDNYEKLPRINQIVNEIILNHPKISVIALQEVTPITYNFIIQSNLKKIYHIPDIHFNNLGYDTIILVHKDYIIEKMIKHKFTHTNMERNLTCVSIRNKNNEYFLIGTSHLESEFKIKTPNKYKIDQFIESFNILDTISMENKNKYHLVIFMADTNIVSRENNLFKEITPNDWIDYFIDFGSPKFLEFTYDHTKNNNVNIPVKSRLDRIYFKQISNEYYPNSLSFLGKEPGENNLYSSDHFGIIASFSN